MKKLMIAVLLVTGNGCNFGSKMFDLPYHREAYAEQVEDKRIADAIVRGALVAGMTIEDAKVSWGPSAWSHSRVAGTDYWTVDRGATYVLRMEEGRVADIDKWGR